MRNIRSLTAITLCALLVFTTAGFQGCDSKPDKAQFLAYAKDINNAFVQFGPIIAQDKPSLKAKWDIGTGITEKVIAAVEASNKTEVIGLIADLIPLVNEVAAEFTNNRTALIILAGANIGLHAFVNHYKPDKVSSGSKRAAQSDPLVIEEFRSKPAWGCTYLPERCKALKVR